MAKKIERTFRNRRLTPDEIARDAEVRRRLELEFPTNISAKGSQRSSLGGIPMWSVPLSALLVLAVVAGALILRSCTTQHYRPHGHQNITFDISPQGDKLVFNAVGEGGRDLFWMDLETGRVSRIAATPWYETNPSFSPDGKSVVYAAGIPGDRADHIFISSLDGSSTRQLTADDANDVFPRFSPDGLLIVFARDKHYNWGGLAANWRLGGVICVVGAEGTKLRQLTSDDVTAYYPHFSPDGQFIRFWSDGHIYEVGVENAKPQRRTSSQVDVNGVYSPDDALIAFSRGRYAHEVEIFVVNADGGGLRQLTKTEDGCFWPVFTPDGEKVLFFRESWPTGPTGVPKRSLWRIRVDGTEMELIADYRLFDDPLNWKPSLP